jgi:hypothetical protein
MHRQFETQINTQGMVMDPPQQYSTTTLIPCQIRAAEDLISLVRQMQELWVFGRLDPAKDDIDYDADELFSLVNMLAARQTKP